MFFVVLVGTAKMSINNNKCISVKIVTGCVRLNETLSLVLLEAVFGCLSTEH